MKIKHYSSTVALLCCAALPVGWVLAQPGEPAAPIDRVRTAQAVAAQAQAGAEQNNARAADEARRAAEEARMAAARAEAQTRESAARAADDERRAGAEARMAAARAEARTRESAARAEEQARRIAAQEEASDNEIRDPVTGMTQTRIIEGLERYAANLEDSFLELKEANESLEQDLERLRTEVADLRNRIR